MKKPLLCRLGFHRVVDDTVGENIGTKTTPVYILTTYESCTRCDWRARNP